RRSRRRRWSYRRRLCRDEFGRRFRHRNGGGLMSDEADFEIQAEPSLRVVTPGAHVTYFLKPRKGPPPPFMRLGFKWFALNDPKSVTFFRFKRIEGPLGRPRWENATWSFEGVH